MRGYLAALAAEGRAVLVSSHLMSELQDTADHLVVIGRGKVIADTSVRELLATASGDRVTVRTTARSEAMDVLAGAGGTVAATDRDVLTVYGLSAERVIALLGAHSVPFSEVAAHQATLEEAYMELTRSAVEYRGRSPGGGEVNTTVTDTSGEPKTTPYQSTARGNDGFPQLLRSEWTKFRTMRGWVIAMIAAAVLVGLPIVALSNGATNNNSIPNQPIGPNGLAVVDSFYFQHRPIGADATITTRVTALTGHTLLPPKKEGFRPPGATQPQPWAKAGVIVKASTKAGSAYAAILVTPDHGVRFQYDFTHDAAGLSGPVSAAAPRWIRLTRAGDLITGSDSVNGRTWSIVGTVRLPGLPATSQAGVFVASPTELYSVQQFANNDGQPFTTIATAKFGRVALSGAAPGGSWRDTQVGPARSGRSAGRKPGCRAARRPRRSMTYRAPRTVQAARSRCREPATSRRTSRSSTRSDSASKARSSG